MPTYRWNFAHRVGLGTVFALASVAGWLGCNSTSSSADDDAGSSPIDDASPAPDRDAARHPDPATADADALGSDGSVPPNSPACITYCNTIQSACAVDYPQFGTMDACLNACHFYPPGTDSDPLNAGNTLKCRQTHATAAGGHCFHGGPYGYGGCGSMCEGFCQIAMAWCAPSKTGPPFASAAACETECEAWAWAPNGPDGAAAYRATSPTTGNTLDCREVELVKSLASAADRDLYCPLAATNSATCM